jgi:protocatechuate 3,4-dioxygenase beta subunit
MKFFLLLLVLGATGTSLAQNVNGIVAGSVLDPAGAVVSNARVRALLPDRQGSRETTTNDAGQYRFVGLTPGTYNLIV